MARVFKRRDRHDAFFWIEFIDEDGRKRRERISPNKRHAEEVLNKRLTEVAERKFLTNRESGRLKFKDFAQDYLDRVVPTLRWADQAARIVGYWVDYFGDKRMAEVTAAEIERYRVDRLKEFKGDPKLKKHIRPATVNREVAVLKRMFNVARQWDVIESNPVTKLRMLPERNARLRYLTIEEAQRLVEAAVPHLRPLLIVGLNTGGRRGELFGLRWQDVDLRARVISFIDTKNGRRRDIPVNAAVCDTLRALPRRGEFVFSHSGGKLASVVHAFKTACKRAGITDFRFHDLRHTFASHAAMSGIDIPTLQQLLGHRTPVMTARYSHLAPSHVMRAVERLDLGRPPRGGSVGEAQDAYQVVGGGRRRAGRDIQVVKRRALPSQ